MGERQAFPCMGLTDRSPTISAVMPSIEQTKRHKTHLAMPLQTPARGPAGEETGGIDEAEGGLVWTFDIDVAFASVGVVKLVLGVGMGWGVLLLLDNDYFLPRWTGVMVDCVSCNEKGKAGVST